MKIKSLIIILFAVSLSSIMAQSIKFEHYNDKNGLSHNSVRHIVQDSHGFLWIGTFSGLNRFDGYQFKNYLSSSEGLNNDDITALELDEKANKLWIGTRKGLTLFETDTRTFTTFLPDKLDANSLPEEEIRSVYVDSYKRVWVGTKTKGVYLFYEDENRFQKVEIDGFDYVKEIFEDKAGNIWIGSYRTGSVAKVSLNGDGEIIKINRFALSNSKDKSPYLNFIFEDDKTGLFVGTREGLFKLNKETSEFALIQIENKALREKVGPYFISIAQGPDGKYWLGTLGGLIVCNQLEDIVTGKFEHHYSVLSDNTSLEDNLVSALFFDPSGVLWIGTEDGLDKFDPYENQFDLNKDISKYIGSQLPRIRGFSNSFDNRIIVATRNNGLFISKRDNFIPLHNTPADIASIYSSDGRTFYCGLWNGKVLVYDYANNSSKIIDVGFNQSPVFAFKSIGKSKIVVGSFGEGVILLNTNTLKVDPSFGVILQGVQINSIRQDRDNKAIWFATETGVRKYSVSNGTIKSYLENETSSLLHTNVSDIVFDSEGKLWAATRLGIGLFDKVTDTFKPLLEPKELVGKWVTDIASVANGDLWLNLNNNNIGRLKKDLKSFNIYHVNSGNRLDVFSSSGFYNFNDSAIYLGGKKGIIHFSPSNINQNDWSPIPVITEFRIQNKEVKPGVNINGQIPLDVDINKGKTVSLDYDNRNFSVQFSSASYSNENLNKYSYILEGFDENWVETNSNSRRIQYTNLFPGDYVFKLKASNSNGYWSDINSYKITIEPPFWLTIEALLLLLLLLLLAWYLIRKEIKNRIKLRKELVTEKVNRERDIKLTNEKLRFFTNISHELRTPLTLILGPAKQLLEDKESSTAYQKSRFSIIHQNANRLLNLVNEVLDFRKAQTGELKLKVSETDILTNTRNTFDSFKEFAFNKQIDLNFISEEDSIIGWIDRDKYGKILNNLLSNALKFSDKYGHVDLFIQLKGTQKDRLVIEVSDDGIGIPLKSQEKIFNRFYQVSDSIENNTGSGIGLSLVKSLVKLHKGLLAVKSKPKEGSLFTVEIPIEKSFYDKAEVFEVEPSLATKAVIKTKEIIHNTDIKDKVLVIEDNAELRSYIVDYLSVTYKVYQAENGEEGLKICRKIKPALCVADVMMPVMDGLTFCQELKKDEFISHIPVLLLTALTENEDKVKGYNVGADAYLAKPFDPTLLKTIIVNTIKTRLDLKSRFSNEIESEVGLLTNSPLDEAFMLEITNLIAANLDMPDLTSTFLCTELGMSSSKLYRKIKELTDLAPNEFIRTIRLKKSAQLLETKKYNVSEVTALVGFNDPLYFSRCFKKQFGFPPSKLL